MNKDLDDRLIPNGEYRDAQNISVGKSEEDDIGALETVLGNVLMTATGLISPTLPSDMTVIGYLADEYSDKIYIFSTNYTDSYPNTQPTYTPSNKRCIIYAFSPGATNADVIVDNVFLNFSTTNPIQASLIENLLFFTDNRNAPRKVNVDPESGISGYYTNEDQLSVAKYNPYLPIKMFKKATGVVVASPAPTTTTFVVSKNINILAGMSVMSTSSTGTVKVASYDYVTVVSAIESGSSPNEITTVTLSSPITAPVAGDIFTFLISTMTNKSSDTTWPGDPDYLESKFVRFSYRYRFDDGEYSLMAPFTQIAYIPKQKGYFINGDEDDAYRSTILGWMENNVNNVELLITLPCLFNQLNSDFKISSIDILYKESDGTSIKVLENLNLSSIQPDTVDNIFSYNYQSRKPYKTLPSDQTTRVYDVVPVRALSQETAGNRIIYGNFRNAYTAPGSIEYDVQVGDKGGKSSTSWVEYPNHSLKQNRNYQVGFVLSDKYGRTSPVILSSVRTSQPNLGSTLFSAYNSVSSNIKAWLGDTLQVSVTQAITSTSNEYPDFTEGRPGLYAIPTNVTGFAITSAPTAISDTQYQFTLDNSNTPSNVTVPVQGDYLRGEYIDYVKVGTVTNDGATPPRYTVPTDGRVNSSYSNNTTLGTAADIKFAYNINPIGWYSYKVVLKQTEQEYYNVYLPGILNGYPAIKSGGIAFPQNEDNKTANIVLINDNINKVPRDLNEVSDQQRQFRSSVQLHGRVENNSATTNIQFFPGILTDTAVSIATSDDSNMNYDNLSTSVPNVSNPPGGQDNLYQIDSKPLIARLSTSKTIGSLTNAMRPFLSIYETDPVDSLLDIFWETNTAGLIADLNADVRTGSDEPVAFTADNFQFLESDTAGHALTDPFWPVSSEGVVFNGSYPTEIISAYYTSVRTGNLQIQLGSANSLFDIIQDGTTRSYTIKLKKLATFVNDSDSKDIYSFFIKILVTSNTLATGATPTLTISSVKLENVAPSFTQSTLPTISITVDEGGNPMPGQNTTAVNGSADALQNQTDLHWSIVSGNPTGTNGNPAFQIEPRTANGKTGGFISQTPTNNAPSGSHTLVLKVQDAFDSNNQAGTGSKSSPNKNQIINIGPIQANTTIRSGCQTGPIDMLSPAGSQQALRTKYNAQYGISGIFYVADGTFTSSSPASGYALTDLPTGVVPSTAQTGDASETNTMFKLGSALSKGTLSLSLNANMTWTANLPSSGLEGEVYWEVYHRTNSSSSWASIADLNNTILDNTANGGKGLKMLLETDASAGAGGVGTYYKQFVLAYNQVGEYLVVANDAKNTIAPAQLNSLAVWVNSNDLYYSTCVIENGVDFAPTVNPSNSGVVQSYQYKIGTSADGGNSFFCPSVISSTTYGYSHVPYGKYVTQFYSTSALTSTISFADAGGGVSNYRAFITHGSSPYHGTDSGTTRFFFSSRFVATTAKVYEPNPWSQNFVQACSTFYGYPRSIS